MKLSMKPGESILLECKSDSGVLLEARLELDTMDPSDPMLTLELREEHLRYVAQDEGDNGKETYFFHLIRKNVTP